MWTMTHLNTVVRRGLFGFVLATVALGVGGVASASPPDTLWIEDIALHPAGPAELGFGYDGHLASDAADVDLVAVRTSSGFDRAPLELSPSIGLVQRGAGPAQIEHLGLRLRYRLAGTPGVPRAVAFVGYRLLPVGERAHRLEQGAAMRWKSDTMTLAAELSAREVVGGDDTQVELRAGVAFSYGMVIDLIRFGVESFVLVPVTGARISDSALGDDPEGVAWYSGPSMRINFEDYVWLAGGVGFGGLVGDGAPALVRFNVGTEF
ncbi:hypothetical protein [Haliangium sp.]|uniref:hypothetical protein n=1 Tax=Haliangium sp. TaxID=2663208 RepID=UPI003D0AC1B2